MDDPSRYPATGDDTSTRPDRETVPGMPRWARVAVIVAIVLVVLAVLVILIMIVGVEGPHNPLLHSGGLPSGGHH
jgi:hypothetical protein